MASMGEAQTLPRVAVLGATGFIGRHLVTRLARDNYPLSILARGRTSFTAEYETLGQCTVVHGDVQDACALHACLQGADICIHLVSTTIPSTSNADPLFDIQSNLAGTIRMLETARLCAVKKIIFASSGGTVYGTPLYLPMDELHPTDPICSYGIVKLAIEKYLFMYQKLHGMDFIALRMANPYGPGQRHERGQGVVTAFMHSINMGLPLQVWGDGTIERDFIYIDDVIDAFICAIRAEKTSGVFNIGTGNGLSLNSIINTISSVLNKSPDIIYDNTRKYDVDKNILDCSKAKDILKWSSKTDFTQGVSALFKSMLND